MNSQLPRPVPGFLYFIFSEGMRELPFLPSQAPLTIYINLQKWLHLYFILPILKENELLPFYFIG